MSLYIVRVELEFAVEAADEHEALDAIDDATRDVFLADHASVTKIKKSSRVKYPHAWDDSSLIYGTDEDTTLGEALAKLETDDADH